MKEWQEQNPGKKVGVSAQHKIIETMTKYSPESKRKEANIKSLEAIAAALTATSDGKGHPILFKHEQQFNLAELVMQHNAILMTVATELANIDNKLQNLGSLGYLEK